MPSDQRTRLASIRRFDQLVAYLRDDMAWPIDSDDFEELTFEYTPAELGIDAKNAAKIQEIKRLRPLSPKQPWGIFFVKFEPKRLPVVALRRILSQVALKKRASANKSERQAWAADDLLFVSNYGEGGERRIAFAHFANPEDGTDLPTLKVLGWDNQDTPLHLDAIADKLQRDLAWPDDPDDAAAWRARWRRAFTLRHREVITTSKELSIRLAELARGIRDRITTALGIETEKGPLTQLMNAFQTALVHDLDADGFADMYAQTIAYGLLSARIADPHQKTADDISAHMRTNPFLRELMETFLKVGGRRGRAGGPGIDFDELGVSEVVEVLDDANMEAIVRDFGDRNPQEDPVIHFYQDFLQQYDARKRVQRGVYYTPRAVVSYIVRSVDELLRKQFGLADGLADVATWREMAKRHENLSIPEGVSPDEAFVQILDPATGTGTFLVEVIEVIHRTLVSKWTAQGRGNREIDVFWNEYVSRHLLPRLHGYELLMAPYAIAHLKISLKLYETGYRFEITERARIYLTNALEPGSDRTSQMEFEEWIPALAHEAAAVNAIKQHQRFTVVIGNPPYSIFSANLSGAAKSLVDKYRYVDDVRIREKGALKAEVILQDDYVKFLGLAQDIVNLSGVGVVGMITNANCYQNPVLRGVRYQLQKDFQCILALDLGGQSKSGVGEDENVFDIDTSVAVTILARGPTPETTRRIARLIGRRSSKYERLLAFTATELCVVPFVPKPEQFLFMAFSSSFGDEYDAGFPIDRAFRVTSIGIKTARDHLVLDFDRAALGERLAALRNPRFSAAELKSRFEIADNTQWKFVEALPRFRATFRESYIAKVEARPFDTRWLYFHPTLVFNTRPGINAHIFRRRNLCLLTMRRIRTEEYAHFFVISRIGMGEIISSADNCNFFPLYLYRDDLLGVDERPETNLTSEFITAIAARLGTGRSAACTPEDILHYAYAVFHSPSYRSRYAEFLKIDFPRLPLTKDLELFRALARFGSELVGLHLLESPRVERSITEYLGGRAPQVEKPSWSKNTVWLDKAQSTGFAGVREDIWNFRIGGYQVCEKWLKDRKGRRLSKDDIAHYQKIVVALAETIRVMKEIDNLIAAHGGWPAAFGSAGGVRIPDQAVQAPNAWPVGSLPHNGA